MAIRYEKRDGVAYITLDNPECGPRPALARLLQLEEQPAAAL